MALINYIWKEGTAFLFYMFYNNPTWTLAKCQKTWGSDEIWLLANITDSTHCNAESYVETYGAVTELLSAWQEQYKQTYGLRLQVHKRTVNNLTSRIPAE